jgi:crossover junction endodeoxyribonuclease RuvC
MRVLGVDPGSRFLGFGLIDVVPSGPRYVAHGVVRANERSPLHERLVDIHGQLEQVVATFRPAVMAVEGLFTHKNSRSALVLGHARGVALLVAAQAGVSVFEYAPARVKKSVGAGGNDGKQAVTRMVHTLLGLDPEKHRQRSDAADALAVALCHAHQVGRIPAVSAASRQAKASTFADRLSANFVGAAR